MRYIYGEVGTEDEETPSSRSEVNQLMPRVKAAQGITHKFPFFLNKQKIIIKSYNNFITYWLKPTGL